MQDKSAESQFISFPATGQNGFLTETVTLNVPVAATDAAIEAVVVAAIADFNQSADKDPVAEITESDLSGFFIDKGQIVCRAFAQQGI